MIYPDINALRNQLNQLADYGALAAEYGYSKEAKEAAATIEAALQKAIASVKTLAEEHATADEPAKYEDILALCPGGNTPQKVTNLEDRMAGAVLGRFVGCTLGAPVEMWSIPDMKAAAKHGGIDFPPTDYWPVVARPWDLRYGVDSVEKYSRDGMDGVPVDDDVTYTILGLLIIERYGFDFTVEDVGEIWKELLPYACTAEDIALKNLQKGIPAAQAGEIDNPFIQWIGADIRADGFGYAAAGNPRLAAKMGYEDAFLSHRRNGIYGEMFFAAAIAAAFSTDCPIEPIRVALKEIPKTCTLYKDMEWALTVGPTLADYQAARDAVDQRFAGMSSVHTNNNAALTVFGLFLGKGDFTATIANVIAMGLDNDCTGATVGSIIGAVVGAKAIPQHWTKPFNNKVRTYINGMPEFEITDVVERFVKLVK